jgi:hypothetical protein
MRHIIFGTTKFYAMVEIVSTLCLRLDESGCLLLQLFNQDQLGFFAPKLEVIPLDLDLD